MSIKVSVVYFSGSGHTAAMAEAVRAGAASIVDTEVQLLALSGVHIKEGRWHDSHILKVLDDSDAILFGTPTYMGCVAAQMKAFMDATGPTYYSRKWKDKIAAGFTVSAGPSGDKLHTLMTLTTFAMQHAMIWVGLGLTGHEDDGGNRLGFYFGAGAQADQEPPDEAPNQVDKDTGFKLGARVAELTRRFRYGADQ